jgi:hypothetical protein
MRSRFSLPKMKAFAERDPAGRNADIRDNKLHASDSQQTRDVVCGEKPVARRGRKSVIPPELLER